MKYTIPYFPGSSHDSSIPTPESLLGFSIGDKAADHSEVERCFRAWGSGNERTLLVEYARSHEGRALYYLVVSSPTNIRNLDRIKSQLAELSDPRRSTGAEAERLMGDLPAVAWMAYTIHGDEMSGTDAALALAYHLSACTDPEVTELLDELVVVIDPLMNPDGRDRWIKQIREHVGHVATTDDQSLPLAGYWPWGRMNHYLFDLNRDWIFGSQPESRGRIKAAAEFFPLLFVDAHEMGGQDTYLFSPPRSPFNPHFGQRKAHWSSVFARDQAAAFDRFGWTYYTGEWNEGWYPGYSDAWAAFRGALGILYEQAGVSHVGIKRPEGTVLTYRESVHHQLASSLANLESLKRNRADMYRDYREEKVRAVAQDGPFANKTWVVFPSRNISRMRRFTDLMTLQGFEVMVAQRELTVTVATDQRGNELRDVKIPAGSLLIPARQPLANLVSAMLDFDPRMPDEFLAIERRELLRRGQSKLYDTTGWNITMFFGLDAVVVPVELTEGVERFEAEAPVATEAVVNPAAEVGFVVDGAADDAIALAARLMERGVQVRCADRAFEFNEGLFSRGSILVTRKDNLLFEGDLVATLEKACNELSLQAMGVTSGWGEGDLPDLGGEHFKLLKRPRIAVFGRGGVNPYDYGVTWFTLDQRLGIQAAYLNADVPPTSQDLRRYNVIVLPDRWYGSWPEAELKSLKEWVSDGGTLIATRDSAAQLAKAELEISGVRLLSDVLKDVTPYEVGIIREYEARAAQPALDQTWSHVGQVGLAYPWSDAVEDSSLSEEERKRRDEWHTLFMPQGAIVATRTDDEHWLTSGCGQTMPALVGNIPILMANTPEIDVPVRVGVFQQARESAEPASDAKSVGEKAEEKKAKNVRRVGWSVLPEGQDLCVRMSGLLWPEATQRIANAALVTRESVGNGQIILFAEQPAFRAATLGTTRIYVNAMILGPGMGASLPIEQ